MQRAEVIALAAARVEHVGHPIDQLPQHFGDRRIISAVEKAPPRKHHLAAVSGAERMLLRHGQKVDITLPRNVEAVSAFAAPDGRARQQRRAADRADQIFQRITSFFHVFVRARAE